MKNTYPKNGNPICPYSKKDCNLQDMDNYTNCSECSEYGNGARATGEMQILNWFIKIIKKLFNN